MVDLEVGHVITLYGVSCHIQTYYIWFIGKLGLGNSSNTNTNFGQQKL